MESLRDSEIHKTVFVRTLTPMAIGGGPSYLTVHTPRSTESTCSDPT